MYVVEINAEDNIVVLGEDKDLYSRRFVVGDFNWISGEAPVNDFNCKVKIRYHQKEQPARICPTPSGKVEIEFDIPQRAITKGQAAVLYDGDIVLGGGTIESVK